MGFLVALSLSTLNFQTPLFAQGSLTPPGAPAPIFKTLQQVEPRTEINATNTPGDSDSVFRISAPGSYYLGSNMTGVSGKAGIEIASLNVIIDLNGFTLQGVPGSLSGIRVSDRMGGLGHRITIRNGVVTGFGEDGINLLVGRQSLIEHVHSTGNTRYGIVVDVGGLVRHCTAIGNGNVGIAGMQNTMVTGCISNLNSGHGISLGGDSGVVTGCIADNNSGEGISCGGLSTVANCAARSNTGHGISAGTGSSLNNCTATKNHGNGISATNGCSLTSCVARDNTSASSSSAGIVTGDGCTITACAATNNTSTNGTPTGATGAGIITGATSKVQNCSASFNKGDGIRASNDNSIVANVCAANGNGGDGAGVHITSSDNRIEENNVTSNDRGIDVDTAGNLIIKNSASGNAGSGTPSANYNIVAGNFVGTIVTTEAAMNSATNSNINISY